MKKIGSRLLIALVSLFVSVAILNGYESIYATEKVSISNKKATLYVGESIELSLEGADGDVTWASSKPKIAKVNSKGKVTALSQGTATISAIYDGTSYNCKISVKSSSLNKDEITLIIGETYKLKVNGEAVASFETSNKAVAKVSSEGKITAKKAGTADIIAVLESGDELICKVTVRLSEELSAKEIYSKCQGGVVEIDAGTSIGSGFFISENTVVTNYHVIDEASSLSIMTLDEKKHKVLKVLGYSEKLDLAILEVDYTGVPIEKNTHGLTMGETTYTIGSSLGFTNTFTNGMISNTNRKIEGVNFIQTNTAISKGNSGGPLINAYGEVIGVTTLYYTQGQNLNLAVDISELDKVDTDKPLSVKKFINRTTNEKGKSTNKNNSSKEQPNITAMVYTGDDLYTSVCALIIQNNGKKKVKIGGSSSENMAIVYPYYDADYSIAYLYDEKTYSEISSKTIGVGKTDACYYVMNESRYISSYEGSIGFVFYYDGVKYLGVADVNGNFTYQEYK